MTRDARYVLAAQAVRAFAYGFATVLLGATLHERGLSTRQAGAVLAAVLAGTVVASLVVGRFGDQVGRRRCYVILYAILAASGVVYAFATALWPLIAVALFGGLSTEVVESGPFTTLEQAMLAGQLENRRLARGFSAYNAIAAAAGSLGALAAAGIAPLRRVWPAVPSDTRCFLIVVPAALAGLLLARRLTARVEAHPATAGSAPDVDSARTPRTVWLLAGLFGLDAFGGGLVVQAFVAFWLSERFGASVTVIGLTFFAIGVLQTASFLAAAPLADRFGLLATMVFTHLPSNLLLIAVAFAPNLATAIGLLLARVVLSQMDVPTRQAYVMALVRPEQRTGAAAVTNTARYLVRPIGPILAGTIQTVGLGAPFVLAGTIKSIYDLVLWRWFRRVPLHSDLTEPSSSTS